MEHGTTKLNIYPGLHSLEPLQAYHACTVVVVVGVMAPAALYGATLADKMGVSRRLKPPLLAGLRLTAALTALVGIIPVISVGGLGTPHAWLGAATMAGWVLMFVVDTCAGLADLKPARSPCAVALRVLRLGTAVVLPLWCCIQALCQGSGAWYAYATPRNQYLGHTTVASGAWILGGVILYFSLQAKSGLFEGMRLSLLEGMLMVGFGSLYFVGDVIEHIVSWKMVGMGGHFLASSSWVMCGCIALIAWHRQDKKLEPVPLLVGVLVQYLMIQGHYHPDVVPSETLLHEWYCRMLISCVLWRFLRLHVLLGLSFIVAGSCLCLAQRGLAQFWHYLGFHATTVAIMAIFFSMAFGLWVIILSPGPAELAMEREAACVRVDFKALSQVDGDGDTEL